MKVTVWDIPTRIFHWSLAAVCATAYITSRTEYYLDVHATAGYAALGLVLFRVLWGFSGNRFARFSSFVKGWSEVRSYLTEFISEKPPRYIGHNPAVGWVILLILAVIADIAVAGIVTYGGEENRGLFAGIFSFATAQYARGIHVLLAYGLIFIIVVHVSAALIHDFYFKENIIASMVTGKKYDQESWRLHFESVGDAGGAGVVRLISLVFLSIVGGWALLSITIEARRDFVIGGHPKVLDEFGMAVDFVPNDTWKAECAESCHGPLHPTLLPSESWKMIITGLDDHFGEDASIDAEAEEDIRAFLMKNSAEHSTTEASQKILWSLVEGEVPLRVTETRYWKNKHSKIKADVFSRKGVVSRVNCGGCHRDAAVGRFEDRNIDIPKPEKVMGRK